MAGSVHARGGHHRHGRSSGGGLRLISFILKQKPPNQTSHYVYNMGLHRMCIKAGSNLNSWPGFFTDRGCRPSGQPHQQFVDYRLARAPCGTRERTGRSRYRIQSARQRRCAAILIAVGGVAVPTAVGAVVSPTAPAKSPFSPPSVPWPSSPMSAVRASRRCPFGVGRPGRAS